MPDTLTTPQKKTNIGFVVSVPGPTEKNARPIDKPNIIKEILQKLISDIFFKIIIIENIIIPQNNPKI